MASRQGNITQAGFDQLTEEGQPPRKPSLALEDEMKVNKRARGGGARHQNGPDLQEYPEQTEEALQADGGLGT